MKNLLVLFALALLSGAVWAADKECGQDVDMADSLKFHELHVDCEEEAVDAYEPGILDKLMGKTKAVETYSGEQKSGEKSAAAAAAVTASKAEAVATPAAGEEQYAGVTFNIREPFTATGGPQSALNGLFAQMIHYCPKGWEKKKEWAEAVGAGYFLYYQFRCAE